MCGKFYERFLSLPGIRLVFSLAFRSTFLLGGVRPDKRTSDSRRKSRFGKKAATAGTLRLERAHRAIHEWWLPDSPFPLSSIFLGGVRGLRLEHIHGYRGFDARNNVRFVDSGRLSLKKSSNYHLYPELFVISVLFHSSHNHQHVLFTTRRRLASCTTFEGTSRSANLRRGAL